MRWLTLPQNFETLSIFRFSGIQEVSLQSQLKDLMNLQIDQIQPSFTSQFNDYLNDLMKEITRFVALNIVSCAIMYSLLFLEFFVIF